MEIEVLVKPSLCWSPKATLVTEEPGMGSLLVILQGRLVQCLKVTSVAGNNIWRFAGFEMGCLVVKRNHLGTDLTTEGLVSFLNKTRH